MKLVSQKTLYGVSTSLLMKEIKLSKIWAFRILIFIAFAIVIFNSFYILTKVFGISLNENAMENKNVATQGTISSYGISYDNAGYEKLLEYYSKISLDSLTEEQKQRFIRIGTMEKTGCGPCCGIQNGPAIDSNGQARCGCGHNLALIGLIKYLVKNYGNKYSDDQIFQEIVKWKKLFFPGQVADDGSVIR